MWGSFLKKTMTKLQHVCYAKKKKNHQVEYNLFNINTWVSQLNNL